MGTSAIGTTGQQIYANDQLAYGLGNAYTTSQVAGRTFIVQSISIAEDGEQKTYKDNTGVTCAIVVPETWQTLNINGLLVKKNGALGVLKKGDEVTSLPVVDGMRSGVKWRVETFTTNWQNEDVANISMTVRSYPF